MSHSPPSLPLLVNSDSRPPDQNIELSLLINDSWLRCHKLMQPGGWRMPHRAIGSTFQSLCWRKNSLLPLAQAALEDAYKLMEYRACCLQILDETGCILWQCGDRQTIFQLKKLGFELGSYWSEEVSGNNAVALALRSGLPCRLSGQDHYKQMLHDWHCCATPIFDQSGQHQAIVHLASHCVDAATSDLSLTLALAREIGNLLNTNDLLEENNRRINEFYALLNCVEGGVLTCDRRGILKYLNESAAAQLKLDPVHSLGQPLSTLLTLPNRLQQAISQQQVLNNMELTFESQRQFIPMVISLKPVHRGESFGFILLLHSQDAPPQHKYLPLPRAQFTFDKMPATSTEMRRLMRYGLQAAKGRHPILLLGEEGVGKEHIGQAIHNASQRVQGPYIAIDCLALPSEVTERELFGCEAGDGRTFLPSKFELAKGGTLYLEQIEHLSLTLQSSLLQIIRTGTLMRTNSSQLVPISARIIAGSQADLPLLVKQGKFRRQLFYTLQSFELHIPPLRQRKSDIATITQHFLHELGRYFGCRYKISDDVLQQFSLYPWPGNDMELQTVIERAAMNCHNYTLSLQDVPAHILADKALAEVEPIQTSGIIPLNEMEHQAIIRVATATKGQLGEMAARLGMSRTTLWRRIRRYQLDVSQFKQRGS